MRADQRRRRHRRAHVERHAGFVVLRKRHVHDRQLVLGELRVFAVAHDADDFAPRSLAAFEVDPLAERIAVAEMPSSPLLR